MTKPPKITTQNTFETLPDGTQIIHHVAIENGIKRKWEEVLRPIPLEMIITDETNSDSKTVEDFKELQAIQIDNRPIHKKSAERLKQVLKKLISDGLITIQQYKRWRDAMGLKDSDNMNDFHLTVLAGEIIIVKNGGIFEEAPF